MSFNPLKRMLLAPRSSHIHDAIKTSKEVPFSGHHITGLEDLSLEEVEALLAEGLGSANGQAADDDPAFLDLIDEIVGDSNDPGTNDPKHASEDDAFISLVDPQVACILRQEESAGSHVVTGNQKDHAAVDSNNWRSSGTSIGTDHRLVRRSSAPAAAQGVKPQNKSTTVREGAEKLVRLMRSGKMSANRVRSAISRSSQRRIQVSERSKRVNDSFLSFDSAYDVRAPSHGLHAPPSASLNQPEVMRKAPMTVGQRVERLEQNVIAAKQEWESKYRVLMMVEDGVQSCVGSENVDSRHVQHKAAVDAAAQKVLEASGDLLLAQVEQGMAKLPGDQIYYYYDDRARLQGPYKAVQLCKLAKLKVMPFDCTVLIDLAQIKGVSVRIPSGELLKLLADPGQFSQTAANGPEIGTDSRPGAEASLSARRNGKNATVSDPRAGSGSRRRNSAHGAYLASDSRHTNEHRWRQASASTLHNCVRHDTRETERWRDSGARLVHTQPEAHISESQGVDAKAHALVHFEEEKALEVYSFEDADGDICGPFSFNELQEKYARGSIAEPLLLMYDTDFGTTVLSVAQLFRNMTQRHEDILAANSQSRLPIETLTSLREVSRRGGAKHTRDAGNAPVSDACIPALLTSTMETAAAATESLVINGAVTAHKEADTCTAANGDDSMTDTRPRDTDATLATSSLPGGGMQTAQKESNADTIVQTSATLPTQLFAAWANASTYSAAPPEGYGAAPAMADRTSLSAQACSGTDHGNMQEHTPAAQLPVMPAHVGGAIVEADDGASLAGNDMDLPTGFDSFEDLLHHVAENQMEPIKQRMLRIQGAQRPSLMARLDFKALRALAEAPVHVADQAIRAFTSLNYEPQDAPTEFLRCLNEQDVLGMFG
eukprot:jgi/Ulvmu1/3353/UM156_0010.1